MALARRGRERGVDYWPGFVDALSTLILGIVFLLSVFVIVQFFLSQEVTGKDTALKRLNAQLAQLTELLSLEKVGKANLEDTLASLRANLATTESERDRLKGLYEGLQAGSGKANELAGQLDTQKSLASRAHGAGGIAQPADRRAAPPTCRARKRARSLREQGQGIAGAPQRSRPAAQSRAGAARAGAVALPLGVLRPAARDPRQPARHPRGRRPLRVPVGSVLRCRSGGPAAGRPRRARQARERAGRTGEANSYGDRLGAARRRPHRRAADRERAVSLELGTVRRARSRWCNT